jgi:hypothetical protein
LREKELFNRPSSGENQDDFHGDPTAVLRRETVKGASLNKEAGQLPRQLFEPPRKDGIFSCY